MRQLGIKECEGHEVPFANWYTIETVANSEPYGFEVTRKEFLTYYYLSNRAIEWVDSDTLALELPEQAVFK